MGTVVFLTVLLIVNIIFGVKDLERGNATKSAAFTWFVIGWVFFHLVTVGLIELL
jgi:hypothetical protein